MTVSKKLESGGKALRKIFVSASRNSDMKRIARSIEMFDCEKNVHILAGRNKWLLGNKRNNIEFAQLMRLPVVLAFLIVSRIRCQAIVFENSHAENILFILISKILRYKVVQLLHDAIPHPGRAEKKVKIYNRLLQLMNIKVVLFSPSPKYPTAPWVKLGGYEINGEFRKNAANGPYVSMIGRLEPYKEIDFFLKVARQTNLTRPDIPFMIAGSGEMEVNQEYRHMTNIKIKNKFLSEQELVDAFEDSKIICLPYSSVTQSGVMVEAWSYGCVTLTSNLPGFKCYHKNEINHIISELDVALWSERIISIYDSHASSDLVKLIYQGEHSAKSLSQNIIEAVDAV
jgi:glycosyltransferase involved in cell wall biosynthesis